MDRNAIGLSIGGFARSQGGRIADNIVDHSEIFGINLRFGANHWRVGLNDLRDNGPDLNLQELIPNPDDPNDPFDPGMVDDNIVHLRSGQTYFDGGQRNRIVIKH